MVSEKKYLKANSVENALKLALEQKENFKFIAGGTDVLVNKFQGNETVDCLIDLSEIAEMRSISKEENQLKIGSLVTLHQLHQHPAICAEYKVLAEAAKSVASPMIRKTATLGGNLLCENRCSFYNQSDWWREAVGYCLKCDGEICIATGGKKNCFSKFVSDMAVALISLNATIDVAGSNGIATVKLEDIYTGDGVNPRRFEKTSIIKAINLPQNEGYKSVFKKLRQRESLEFSSLTTVVTVSKNGAVKIVLGGVDPKPVVVEGILNNNKEDFIKQALKKARIVDNDVFTRKYRHEMIGVYLKKSFEEILTNN